MTGVCYKWRHDSEKSRVRAGSAGCWLYQLGLGSAESEREPRINGAYIYLVQKSIGQHPRTGVAPQNRHDWENYFKDCVMGLTQLLDIRGLGVGLLEKNATYPVKFQFQVNSKCFKKYNCVSLIIAWRHTRTKKKKHPLFIWNSDLTAVTNCHKFSGFKQHKLILLRFRRPEASHDQQARVPGGDTEGEPVFLPFPASRDCLCSLACGHKLLQHLLLSSHFLTVTLPRPLCKEPGDSIGPTG